MTALRREIRGRVLVAEWNAKQQRQPLCKLFPSAFVCKAAKHGLNKISLSAPTDKEREREKERKKRGGGGGGRGWECDRLLSLTYPRSCVEPYTAVRIAHAGFFVGERQLFRE